MRLLVAEDQPQLARFLAQGLEKESYAVDVAADGEQALQLADAYDYDLAILDVDMPRCDGFQALSRLRESHRTMPVIMLTSLGSVQERVRGLDMGANDYVVKPFSFHELCARIRVLLRADATPSATQLKVDDLELDRAARTVRRGGRDLTLTPKEFSLLEYLMRCSPRRVTRAMIIEHVWNVGFDSSTNVVDVYINYIRSKVDRGFPRPLIHTVRGVGYQLCADEQAAS